MRISSPSRVIPALLTSTSTGPWRSSISVKARSTASASVTSHCTPNSPSGAPLPRWVTATESPCSANERAMASPIPRLPPVTSTDLPLEPTVPLPCRRPLRPSPNLSGRLRSHPITGSSPVQGGRDDLGPRFAVGLDRGHGNPPGSGEHLLRRQRPPQARGRGGPVVSPPERRWRRRRDAY